MYYTYKAKYRRGYKKTTKSPKRRYIRTGASRKSVKPKYSTFKRKRAVSSTVPLDPMKAIAATRSAYVRHVSQVDSGPLIVPTGVISGVSDTLQAVQYRQFNLQAWSPLDPIVQNYMACYQEFRTSHVWVELTPKWNTVPDVKGNQIGEIIVVPLHNQEEIYRSGQANVGFGGTFPAVTELDVDQWLQIPGAKRFRFDKPGMMARIKIPLTVFDYVLDNAMIGDGSSSAGATVHVKKAPWLNVMDAQNVTIPVVNSTRHYGYFLGFFGWSTVPENAEFAFKFRQYIHYEFRRQVAFPVSSFGTRRKAIYGSEEKKEDEEPLHVEEPWDEEDEKTSQMSTTAVKRQFTNMSLEAAHTLSAMGPPAPRVTKTTSTLSRTSLVSK